MSSSMEHLVPEKLKPVDFEIKYYTNPICYGPYYLPNINEETLKKRLEV